MDKAEQSGEPRRYPDDIGHQVWKKVRSDAGKHFFEATKALQAKSVPKALRNQIKGFMDGLKPNLEPEPPAEFVRRANAIHQEYMNAKGT